MLRSTCCVTVPPAWMGPQNLSIPHTENNSNQSRTVSVQWNRSSPTEPQSEGLHELKDLLTTAHSHSSYCQQVWGLKVNPATCCGAGMRLHLDQHTSMGRLGGTHSGLPRVLTPITRLQAKQPQVHRVQSWASNNK